MKRKLIALLAGVALVVAAACSSPTAPKGCDVVSTSSGTC
jgi:hypothetical protein